MLEISENKQKTYFSFDIESLGVFGDAFAYGYVVVNEDGLELDCGMTHIPFEKITSYVSDEDKNWLSENVFPNLDKSNFISQLVNNLEELCSDFWTNWVFWKDQGALLITDVGFPVETNFLSLCMAYNEERKANSPYPLLDVSSVLLANGKNSVGTYNRLDDELPCHNPLNDARQSARIFIENMKELKEKELKAKQYDNIR